MRKQSLLKNPFQKFFTCTMVASLSMAALLGLSTSVSAGGPNIECPTGTTLVAKFEWTSGGYDFEKSAGNGELVKIITGDAESGSWTSSVAISHVILKGGTDTHTYSINGSSGDFSKEVLEPKKAGKASPDISNIQFCGPETDNADAGGSDAGDSDPDDSDTDTGGSDTGNSDTGGSDTANSDDTTSGANTANGTNVDDVCEVIYGVHDEGLNDSQLVTISAPDYGVNILGTDGSGFHPDFDLEGLDMNAKIDLYATSGDDVPDPLNNAGVLFKININTGAIEERLGQICFPVEETQICGTEISAISFRPSDGSLWAWSEECGLIEVNMDSIANSTLFLPNEDLRACLSKNPAMWRHYTSYIEDMTWDNAGEVIYYSLHGQVLSYNPDTGENIPVSTIGGNIETLEMFPESNELLIVVVDGSQYVKTVHLPTGEVISAEASVGDFNDIEGVAACIPFPTTDAPQEAASESVQITLDDDRGSTYEITLLSHDAPTKTWTYRVEKLDAPEGQKDYKDLSHFSLGIGRACQVDDSTRGSELGKDGSSNNFWGIKWNVKGGTFSVTFTGDYKVGSIPVLAKSSTEYDTENIKGPVCPGELGGFPD